MYLADQAVSREFRTAVIELLPGLKKHKSFMKLAGYLMFTAGQRGREILVPAILMAKVEDKDWDCHYCAGAFLRSFQEHVVMLKIAEAEHMKARCRAVTKIYWPPELETLIRTEMRSKSEDKVNFVTGAKWTRNSVTKERKSIHAAALELIESDPSHPASKLLDLLNNNPSNRYGALKDYLSEAHDLVDKLSYDHFFDTRGAELWEDEISNVNVNIEIERARQHLILMALHRQPQPFYKPGERSARVFAINESLGSLQRDVRKFVTQDWITADLKQAQLAIVAKIWGVPAVTAFLESQRSIWTELSEWMHVDPALKPVLKKALYALIFGAGRDRMISILGSHGYHRWMQHPLIASLHTARDKQLQIIQDEKYGVDAYGKYHALHHFQVDGKAFHYSGARKILALIAQSYELLLLQPVVDLAYECKDSSHEFWLCSWLHDGFCFDCREQDRTHWINTLTEAVDSQARSLGIATSLGIETD